MNKEIKLVKKDYRQYVLLALILLVMIYGFVDYFNNHKANDNQIVETDTNKQTDKSNNTSDSKQSTTDKTDTKESDKDKTTTNQTENKDTSSQTTNNTNSQGNKPASNTGNTNTGNTNGNNSNTAGNNSNTNSNSNTSSGNSNSGSNNQQSGHWEERLVRAAYDEQVLVQAAYDEQVLVKKGACENVLVKAAWDEVINEPASGYFAADKVEVYVCNQCGAVFYDGSISDHVANSDTCGGWHNDWVDSGDPYWHNLDGSRFVPYSIHHDPVYEQRCQPDEYKTVHHDAVYKTVHHDAVYERVWVND